MPILDLSQQTSVSNQRGLPVDDLGASQANSTISSETVQLFYDNGGTRTTDAGEAAGTAVSGKIAYGGIQNTGGGMLATYLDTSLTFTSTALTNEVVFPIKIAERYDSRSYSDRLANITSGFSNGDYCVDYRNGIIYGVKASTQTSLTATSYEIVANVFTESGGGGTSDVNLAEVAGTATSVDNGTSDAGTQRVTQAAGEPQALGTDATGADAYATVITTGATAPTHVEITLQGSNDAIISLDAGVTDHIYIPANSIVTRDNISIGASTAIQAKNAVGGSNYSTLSIAVW